MPNSNTVNNRSASRFPTSAAPPKSCTANMSPSKRYTPRGGLGPTRPCPFSSPALSHFPQKWKWSVPKPVFHVKAAHTALRSCTTKSCMLACLCHAFSWLRQSLPREMLQRFTHSPKLLAALQSTATTFCGVRSAPDFKAFPRTAKSGRARGFDILCSQPACPSGAWLKNSLAAASAFSCLLATSFAASQHSFASDKKLLSPACHFRISFHFSAHQPCCAACLPTFPDRANLGSKLRLIRPSCLEETLHVSHTVCPPLLHTACSTSMPVPHLAAARLPRWVMKDVLQHHLDLARKRPMTN